MFYLTYRFNESAIITVTIARILIDKPIGGDNPPDYLLATFTDVTGTSHTIESATIISIVPAPKPKRKRGTC